MKYHNQGTKRRFHKTLERKYRSHTKNQDSDFSLLNSHVGRKMTMETFLQNYEGKLFPTENSSPKPSYESNIKIFSQT